MKAMTMFVTFLCLLCTSAFAAVPKAETFKLGTIEKKLELVSLQQGCGVVYQGKEIARATSSTKKCEQVYENVASNLKGGGYTLADASAVVAPAPVIPAPAVVPVAPAKGEPKVEKAKAKKEKKSDVKKEEVKPEEKKPASVGA
jgi:hypothetical protein